MVNAGVVNARSACFPHADFCEIFRALGQFPRFQNPFKYNRRLRINHKRAASGGARHSILLAQSKCYTGSPRLTLLQSASAKLIQHRKAPQIRGPAWQTGLTGA
jgi:hypothetical protein